MSTGTGGPSAQLLGEEQRAALVAPLLVERVLVLAMERAVQLEPAAPDVHGELLDRLQEHRGDPLATLLAIDHELVEVADRPGLPQAVVERQRPEADDPRVDLGAQIPLARRSEP